MTQEATHPPQDDIDTVLTLARDELNHMEFDQYSDDDIAADLVRSHASYDRVETMLEAAPAMLEALQGLFEHCAMVHKHWGDGCNAAEAQSAIDSAKDAIAQATGKE